MTSLLICTLMITIQARFVLLPEYKNITLPLGDGREDLENAFMQFENLASIATVIRNMISFNLLFIFIRALMLIRDLSPKLGLLTTVIGSAAENLFWFLLMFTIFFSGMGLFAHFTFGPGFDRMRTMDGAMFDCFQMLLGRVNYTELHAADPFLAPVFFYGFYIAFFFILLNMFISIVLTAYDLEKFNLDQSGGGGESLVGKIASYVLGPIIFILKKLFGCIADCIPKGILASLPGRGRGKSEMSMEMDVPASDPGEKKLTFYQQNEILIEGAVMGCLAVVFGIGVTLQLRGGDFFYGTQSSLLPTRDSTWQELTPLRNMDFDSIESFRDVYNWAHETFVEDYYNDVRCARKQSGTGKTILCPGGDPVTCADVAATCASDN